jgi:hypothetical protein
MKRKTNRSDGKEEEMTLPPQRKWWESQNERDHLGDQGVDGWDHSGS